MVRNSSKSNAAEAAVLSRLSPKAQRFVERARSFKSRAERPEPSDNEILLALAGCRDKDKVAFNIAAVIAGTKPAASFVLDGLTPLSAELLRAARRLGYSFAHGQDSLSNDPYAFIGKARNVNRLERLYRTKTLTDFHTSEFQRELRRALGYSRAAVQRFLGRTSEERAEITAYLHGHPETLERIRKRRDDLLSENREQLEHDELMLRLLDAKRALTGNPNVGRDIEWAITERALAQIEPVE